MLKILTFFAFAILLIFTVIPAHASSLIDTIADKIKDAAGDEVVCGAVLIFEPGPLPPITTAAPLGTLLVVDGSVKWFTGAYIKLVNSLVDPPGIDVTKPTQIKKISMDEFYEIAQLGPDVQERSLLEPTVESLLILHAAQLTIEKAVTAKEMGFDEYSWAHARLFESYISMIDTNELISNAKDFANFYRETCSIFEDEIPGKSKIPDELFDNELIQTEAVFSYLGFEGLELEKLASMEFNTNQTDFEQLLTQEQIVSTWMDFEEIVVPNFLQASKELQAEGVPLPPKKQEKFGFDEIVCKEGLELIFKSTNGSPACVKPQTVQKLIERVWASP